MSSSQIDQNKSTRKILVVGSPNSGKTTLYNWLTGSKSKTVNYPGATVEYSEGGLQSNLASGVEGISFIDTPGIYSLEPQSEDEKVTVNILKHDHNIQYQAVILVIDATQLNRQLLLAKQLVQPDIDLTVVLTMNDLVAKQRAAIQVDEIKSFLGVSKIVLFDGITGDGIKDVVAAIKATNEKNCTYSEKTLSEQQKVNELRTIAEFIQTKAFRKVESHTHKQSQLDFTLKVDRWLLHPFWGYVFFFTFMTLFFASIYWVSAPIMDLVDMGMASLIDLAKQNVAGLTGEFIGDGLLAAVGGVVIFVPQIFILFLGIGLFENTGYLSRVAALVDGPLKKIGLGGRSFVPMLSGFACAIPAIMATRNITSTKERLIAQLVIPFMSCSARLPVYGLMIGFLFKEQNALLAGLTMALLYFGSLLFGAIASALLAKIIQSSQTSRLLMDLPYYRRPRVKTIFMQSVQKSVAFIKRAGPVIGVLAIVLWLATTFPRLPENAPEGAEAPPSYAMQVASAIEPVFKPMGVDGRVGFALLASFAAREVFVSSLAVSLQADLGDDEENTTPILDKMTEAKFADGTPIFSLATVVGILIFFIIATQCISTVGVLKKESNSWKWTLIQLFGSNIIAYTLAVAAVQVLKAFGF